VKISRHHYNAARSPNQLCDTAPGDVKVTQIEPEKLAEFLKGTNSEIKKPANNRQVR
jgi:hypothetical protein